jgi:hypothetical protein
MEACAGAADFRSGASSGLTSGRRVNVQKLFVLGAQHPASLRIYQMRLGACKARHLNVGEVIVFGVISDPSLDVLACVGTAVEEGGHDLALLFQGATRIYWHR